MKNINDLFNIDLATNVQTFKKGHILQQQGSLAIQSFYVQKGLLRSYAIDKKGKEHIFMFAPEGWVIGDIESLEFKKPAELYIECLENSEIVVIDKNTLKLSKLSEQQLAEHVNLLSRRIGVLQRRIIMMMSAPAAERYELFLETYPFLQNRISQRLIASYLGITPEALSKIRGEITRSK